MSTLIVTHGEWVRTRSTLELPPTELLQLRQALEHESADIRRAAQTEVLRRARAQGGWPLESFDATLEALEYPSSPEPGAVAQSSLRAHETAQCAPAS